MITRDRTGPSPAQEESMAKLPKPGQPVRGSRSGAPIMALFDLLGRRWAMGVLWTLSEGGAMTFRELQERCATRSEEHTSELQSLMRISYAVFCLKKKKSM